MSTVVNQGTTIDNLPSLDSSLTPAQKQAFIDGAFVPIRGEVNGTKTTVKVTGNDLAASGANKIDSISVNGTNLEIDENKNVDIEMVDIPEPNLGSGGTMLMVGNGTISWGYPAFYISDDNTLEVNDHHELQVSIPVPEPSSDHSNAGMVLTVQRASDPNDPDEIVWDAPQGGLPTYDSTYAGRVLTVNQAGNGVEWTTPQGGGGNPYTKVSVTPGARYENGKTSEYYYNLLDQDVDIVNNTYSILSTPIGYEQSEYPNSENVDVFKIKLPANTEFPLAIVEFNIEHGHEHDGAVNDIKVYVGSTELTRIYDTPYNQNTVIADSDGDIWFSNASYPNGIKKSVSGDDWIMPAINDSNMIKTNTAFVTDWRNDTNVTCQVHIFGNCFSVKTSLSNSYPSGS